MANNSNQTVNFPSALGDIMGVGDYEMEAETHELLADKGVLGRGSVLAKDVSGKLILVAAANEANVYGILLDPSVDTASAAGFSTGVITGSVARSGSFKGQALIVTAATDVAKVTDNLRVLGIYVDGPIPNV